MSIAIPVLTPKRIQSLHLFYLEAAFAPINVLVSYTRGAGRNATLRVKCAILTKTEVDEFY